MLKRVSKFNIDSSGRNYLATREVRSDFNVYADQLNSALKSYYAKSTSLLLFAGWQGGIVQIVFSQRKVLCAHD